MGGGSATAVRGCDTLALSVPRKDLALTQIWLAAPVLRLPPGTSAVAPVTAVRRASRPGLSLAPHVYVSGRADAPPALSTALSHLPMTFGPSTVMEGSTAALGALTVRLAAPAASEAPSAVATPPPRNVIVSPGTMVAPGPSVTPKVELSVQTHDAPAPSGAGGATRAAQSAGPTICVLAEKDKSTRLPTLLKSALTGDGAAT
mmetsp:Transcript_34647/g.83691  ORF Transcript_34647/g.83691 Transcript_34647/m.83691 type:complete len:203 (+) Transcript_34647:134-742(+)